MRPIGDKYPLWEGHTPLSPVVNSEAGAAHWAAQGRRPPREVAAVPIMLISQIDIIQHVGE